MKKINILISISAFFLLFACSNDSTTEEVEEIGEDRFVSFQYLEVVTKDMNLLFTGDVSTSEEQLYYTIQQNDEVIIEEQVLEIEQTDEEWVSFEIEEELSSDVEKDSDIPPVISIYGKTEKGTEINPNYIPVDLNME